jgi:HSP20 family protein
VKGPHEIELVTIIDNGQTGEEKMTTILTSRIPVLHNDKAFDRAFDGIWKNWPLGSSLHGELAGDEPRAQVDFPRVDAKENDERLLVVAELPGLKREEIQVTVHDGALTISGERKNETEEKGEGYLRREISRGSFKRTFVLPETVDVEKIDAKYEDGVLKIEFPKVEEAKPKQIDVKIH